MYLHGLLRAVEAAPAFHQPYHLHCTDKAGFPGAFYNILLPCGQLVQKIQKRAIPTKGRHVAHAHTHHIVICMHWRISGHTGTLHHMKVKIGFWAIPHQSNIMITVMFCCVQAKKSLNSGAKSEQRTPKPATARDLALSPWQSVEVGRWVGGCYRLSLQSVSS